MSGIKPDIFLREYVLCHLKPATSSRADPFHFHANWMGAELLGAWSLEYAATLSLPFFHQRHPLSRKSVSDQPTINWLQIDTVRVRALWPVFRLGSTPSAASFVLSNNFLLSSTQRRKTFICRPTKHLLDLFEHGLIFCIPIFQES